MTSAGGAETPAGGYPAGDGLCLSQVEFLPELRLYLFDASVGLFDPAGGEYRSDRPPPFWGFAWAGGQAVARYVLDHAETVRGRRVLDLACGSGLVAVAAAKAGAAHVVAVDVDPGALTEVKANARANGVRIDCLERDILAGPLVDVDLVLAGDVYYSEAMADRVDGFLRRMARAGAGVLVGDPDRGYLKSSLFRPVATYDIPVSIAVEGVSSQRTTVFELRSVTAPDERVQRPLRS